MVTNMQSLVVAASFLQCLELMLELMVRGETALNLLGSKWGGHFKGIKSLLNLEAQHLAVIEDLTDGQSDRISVLPENEAYQKPNMFQQQWFQRGECCGVGIIRSSGVTI